MGSVQGGYLFEQPLTSPRRADDIPTRFLQGQDACMTFEPTPLRTLNTVSGLQSGREADCLQHSH